MGFAVLEVFDYALKLDTQALGHAVRRCVVVPLKTNVRVGSRDTARNLWRIRWTMKVSSHAYLKLSDLRDWEHEDRQV